MNNLMTKEKNKNVNSNRCNRGVAAVRHRGTRISNKIKFSATRRKKVSDTNKFKHNKGSIRQSKRAGQTVAKQRWEFGQSLETWDVESTENCFPFRELLPEGRMWWSVLARAIVDACLKEGSIRRDASKWIFNDDIEVGTFLWVCERLDIRGGEIRLRVLRGDKLRSAERFGFRIWARAPMGNYYE